MNIQSCLPPSKAEDSSKKKTPRHSRSSTRVLKEWFSSHSSYPYPTDEEKEALSQRTGLSIRQISHWFVNARRRKPVSSGEDASNTVAPSMPSSMPAEGTASWGEMTPLDRWRNSPPDEEPVSWDAISKAIGNGGVSYGTSQRVYNSNYISENSSLRSSTGSQSSGSSAHSWSSGSLVSLHSHRKSRQRRRRSQGRALKSLQTSGKDSDKELRIYQCTFCTDTFKSRYDWTRHEGTLHLLLEKWTCLASGPRYCRPSESVARCVFCDAENPSTAHLDSHRSNECASRPLNVRSFFRKDHLRQHLRKTHGISDVRPCMEDWKSKINNVKSRCGFCGETFNLWSDRNDHLTDHFRDGARMKDWKGCRGLEAAVALLVENAMPPYLIGLESNDLEPFSASHKNQEGCGLEEGRPSVHPTRFEMLTAHLGEFVKIKKGSGISITDEMLQREARMILYGEDDPWNQTPADNPEWLNLFKTGYGLCTPWGLHPDPTILSTTNEGTLGTQTDAEAAVFSPFTLDKMRQAAMSGGTINTINFCEGAQWDRPECNLQVPLAWQTPECLAEFRLMGLLPSLSGTDMAINSVSARDSFDVTCGKNPSMSAYESSFMNSCTTGVFADQDVAHSTIVEGNFVPVGDIGTDQIFSLEEELHL